MPLLAERFKPGIPLEDQVSVTLPFPFAEDELALEFARHVRGNSKYYVRKGSGNSAQSVHLESLSANLLFLLLNDGFLSRNEIWKALWGDRSAERATIHRAVHNLNDSLDLIGYGNFVHSRELHSKGGDYGFSSDGDCGYYTGALEQHRTQRANYIRRSTVRMNVVTGCVHTGDRVVTDLKPIDLATLYHIIRADHRGISCERLAQCMYEEPSRTAQHTLYASFSRIQERLGDDVLVCTKKKSERYVRIASA